MSDKLINFTDFTKGEEKILNGENFFTFSDFLGFNDMARLIKFIYVIISLILNLFIIISILKLKKRKLSVTWILTVNILFMNFIHSSAYLYNWMNKTEGVIYLNDENTPNGENRINKDEKYYEIGGLLIGNLSNLVVCKIQAFMLVFSALSQDISINIFFFMINMKNIPTKKKVRLILISFAHCLPFLFTLTYFLIDGLGLNDRFCYVKKFGFKEIKSDNNYKYKYKFFYNGTTYKVLIYIIYFFRTTNLIISSYLLYNIIKYIHQNNKSKIYILKSSAILILQMITIVMGFIYRVSGNFSDAFSTGFATTFLFINTLDAILFPLYFSLTNGVFKILFCRNEIVENTQDEDEKLINSNDDSISEN